jgi:hypothetical protein
MSKGNDSQRFDAVQKLLMISGAGTSYLESKKRLANGSLFHQPDNQPSGYAYKID